MDPLSRLPPECFVRILVALVNDNSCATLAALLQTNRYFATLTLPYLYKDPYRFAPYEEGNRSPSYDTRSKDPLITGIPTLALLNFLPPSTVLPKVLSLAIQPVDTTVTADSWDPSTTTVTVAATATAMSKPPMFDYITQIRHLTPQPWTIGLDQFWKWNHPPPGVSDFILSQEFQDLCNQANLLPTEDWSLQEIRTSSDFWSWCFQVLFQCKSNWVLADSIMEQLQSLTIPFSDLGRYAEPATMCRMKRLERVHFILEFLSEAKEQEEYLEKLRDTVRFVKEHMRLFPRVLMSASISLGTRCPIQWANLDIPRSILEEIAGLLPELRRPTSVTTTDSVLQLMAHAENTDVSRLEELDTTLMLGLSSDKAEPFNPHQHILQRCRSLRMLRTTSWGAGSFQWAVDEKRRLLELGGHDTVLSRKGKGNKEEAKEAQNLQRSSTSQPQFWKNKLIPIEDLYIFGLYNQDSMDEANNAAFAFSQSLKTFEINCFGSDNEEVVRLGEGWVDMPVLTRLSYTFGFRSLAIDPQLLSFCCNVVSIHLYDENKEYQCDDIEPCLSARLPHLKSLTLQGMPALSFHPATFHTTTQLTDLSVTVTCFSNDDFDYDFDYESTNYEGDDFTSPHCYIPPLDELYRSYGLQDNCTIPSTPPRIIRPNWTWDWDLPHLVSLKLSSEFAFLFQFRMLQGCLALQTLELEIRTYGAGHTRTITESDMIHSSSGKPIVLPALTKLRMHGPWEFPSPSFALQFLTGMFPNLEYLSAIGWTGISLQDMIQLVVRRMPKPVKELCMGEVSRNGLTQAERDLFLGGGLQRPVNQEEVLTTVIIRRIWYYLMREGR
ncbi:MAG: hypothetical protein JOS17DRAFT_792804 [Linnemannia elongata]|nr:MAG: hypothetical protein JOS17DRAFT_792804 [Linnemannia elongata]